MELNKQLKLINRKFAYNTGKLPGFYAGKLPWEVAVDATKQLLKDNPSLYDQDDGVHSGYKPGMWDTEIQPMQQELKLPEILPSQNDVHSLSANGSKVANKINISNIQTGLGGVGQLAAGIAESFNAKSKDEFLAEYKPVQRTVAGRAYTALAKAKDGKLPGYAPGKLGSIANSAIGGATAGSVAGPWGAFIGGAAGLVGGVAGALISGKKEEENERTVSDWVKQYNNGERSNTISQIMGEDNQGLYGNLYAQSLIHHANGKLPGFENGLESAIGKVSGEATAMVSNGEVMSEDGYMHRVGKGKDSNDTRRAIAGPRTTIFPNKGASIFGEDISDFVWRTGDVNTGTEMLRALNAMKSLAPYKNGKLPRCAEGWLGNGIPALFGTVAGLGQYLDAIHNTPYHPRTYAANPYETTALNTLAGLRINPYPIARQLRDAEARSNRAIDMAGGLSGSQRTAARLANLNTTQGNISNLLSSIQQQNNAYRANYAQAALDAGNKSRAARMSANQWDLDYYSKAHAARNKGMQTGIANMLAQIQQYQANEFKRRQFNETMSLYRDDLKQKQDLFKWYANNFANTAVNPSTLYFNQMSPYEKWMLLQNRGIIK